MTEARIASPWSGRTAVVPRVQAKGRRVFETLNGLRGLAALVVLCVHMRASLPPLLGFASGELAVDLFFMLSGFVLAEAYGASFDAGMDAPTFLRLRLRRLYPLYALGAILGLAHWLGHDRARLLTAAPLALAMLPNPFGAMLYPTNIPAWSLFFELVANAILALLWRRLSAGVLAMIVGVGAAGLVAGARLYGGLSEGFLWDGFFVGFARVCFSFFLGVALHRMRLRAPAINPWLILAAMLALLSLAPGPQWRWLVDLAVVMLGAPALILLGAAARTGPQSRPVFALAGLVSYALYAIHAPLLTLANQLASRLRLETTPALVLAEAAAVLFLAWIAARALDPPARRRPS